MRRHWRVDGGHHTFENLFAILAAALHPSPLALGVQLSVKRGRQLVEREQNEAAGNKSCSSERQKLARKSWCAQHSCGQAAAAGIRYF